MRLRLRAIRPSTSLSFFNFSDASFSRFCLIFALINLSIFPSRF